MPFPIINLSKKDVICFDEDDNHWIWQTKIDTDNCKKNHLCSLTQMHSYLLFTKKIYVKQAVYKTGELRHCQTQTSSTL